MDTDLDGNPIWGGDELTVQILANDPRFTPIECVRVNTPADGWSLSQLEALTDKLRSEYVWGTGAEESYTKQKGGIGASGPEILGLALGAIGAYPAVVDLLKKLNRNVPTMATREAAWETATWAIAMQYKAVPRPALRLVEESRSTDHWSFTVEWPETKDVFEVEVYGSADTTNAQMVKWTNGDPWGRGPGLAEPTDEGSS